MMSGILAQAWRDLLWLVKGPDLITFDHVLPLPLSSPRDENLSWEYVLRHFESRAFHRVGYYMESLIGVWLEGTPGVSGIEHGVRIQEGKITLGELDFLFRQGHRLHHLEVALKFFLHLPFPGSQSCATHSHFRGPNASDNFEKKRNKLLHAQLPLGRNCFPEIAESHSLVRGMIFYEPGKGRPDSLPEGMNPDHLRGVWIRSNELDWLLDSPRHNGRGLVMEKPFWLGGIESPPGSPPPGLPIGDLQTAIRVHFRERESPLLLSLAEENDAGWRETDRIFVVSQKWPGDGPSA